MEAEQAIRVVFDDEGQLGQADFRIGRRSADSVTPAGCGKG